MPFPARVPVRSLAVACLLFGALGSAHAQTASNQTGALRVPGAPRAEQPMKPPAAAPRTPVHKSGETAEHAVPVVAPRRSGNPPKPATAAAPHPAEAAIPVPPVPPTTPPPVAAPSGTPPDATAAAVPPAKLADPEKPEGAKLPRFASLRSDAVNMRAGPGTRYRIEWVYKRRDLPVEIEREYDVWRWVRDPEGTQGWVHQATLMGRRSFVVQNADATLRSAPNDTASPVAILKVGVIGHIRSCEPSSDWCNVQAGSYRGYLKRDQFWGTLPGEAIYP